MVPIGKQQIYVHIVDGIGPKQDVDGSGARKLCIYNQIIRRSNVNSTAPAQILPHSVNLKNASGEGGRNILFQIDVDPDALLGLIEGSLVRSRLQKPRGRADQVTRVLTYQGIENT